MHKAIAWTLTWAAIAVLAFHAPSVAFAAGQPPLVTIDECRALSDADVRDRVRELASTNLKTELAAIDYQALVAKHWFKLDIDAKIDTEVDIAIADVRANTSWADRAYSTVSSSSAERYARAVADKTYNSRGFKGAIEELATAVARDAAVQIEKATAKVSNPIIACVQTALQSRYGGAVAQVFAAESQKDIEAKGEQPAVKIGGGDLALHNAGAISGIVLIVTRRVIAAAIEKIGSRIAGVIASRVASAVSGIVGAVLIAKDLYEAGDGVFPIVADRMKAFETKNLIRDEIGKAIQHDIGEQTGTIAQETADRIYAVWLDFKQKYKRLLTLSEKSEAFAAFLKDRRLEQLSRLGQIVDLLYTTEGEDRIIGRVNDGSLDKMLLDLNDAGLVIAQDRKSVEVALRWAETAGPDLPRVVDLGLYRMLPPDGLTRESLGKILALPDKAAVLHIATLTPQSREFVLSLPADQMRRIAHSLSEPQLAAFAEYELRLDPSAARRLLEAASENPAIMQDLSGEGIQNAIFSSRNQAAAVGMAIRDDAGFVSYSRILTDASLVRNGDVTARVFWERYWFSLGAALFVLFVLLSWIRRLLFPRPQIVIKTDSKR